MGKKSRVKKLRRIAKTADPTTLELRELRHPFAQIPADQLRRGIAEIGRNQAKDFAATTVKVQELIREINPLDLLASYAVYGLTSTIGEDGSIRPGKERVIAAHVELAQAMCLRLRQEEHAHMPALSRHMQALSETIAEWAEQFHRKRLAQVEVDATDLERARVLVQEQIRFATQ